MTGVGVGVGVVVHLWRRRSPIHCHSSPLQSRISAGGRLRDGNDKHTLRAFSSTAAERKNQTTKKQEHAKHRTKISKKRNRSQPECSNSIGVKSSNNNNKNEKKNKNEIWQRRKRRVLNGVDVRACARAPFRLSERM